jgi:hypothetical protein
MAQRISDLRGEAFLNFLKTIFKDDTNGPIIDTIDMIDDTTANVCVNSRQCKFKIEPSEFEGYYTISASIGKKFRDCNVKWYGQTELSDAGYLFDVIAWFNEIKIRMPELFYRETQIAVAKYVDKSFLSKFETLELIVVTTLRGIELQLSESDSTHRNEYTTLGNNSQLSNWTSGGPRERKTICVPIMQTYLDIKLTSLSNFTGSDNKVNTFTRTIHNMLVVICQHNKQEYRVMFGDNYKTDAFISKVLTKFLLCMWNNRSFPYEMMLNSAEDAKQLQEL